MLLNSAQVAICRRHKAAARADSQLGIGTRLGALPGRPPPPAAPAAGLRLLGLLVSRQGAISAPKGRALSSFPLPVFVFFFPPLSDL